MLEREFYYWCLIHLDYALALINNRVTKKSEQTSAMYGEWITKGKPVLSGFKEFDNTLKKIIRKIIKDVAKAKN